MGVDTLAAPDDLYCFLRDSGFKVLSNLIYNISPGHQIQEMDYFLRKYHAGDIPRDGRYLWIQRASQITQAMVAIYGAHFRQYGLGMMVNDSLFDMMVQITRMLPELGIDVGLSHIKNAVACRDNTAIVPFADGIKYAVSNEAVLRAYLDYYGLRRRTADFDPWTQARPAIEGRLADLVGGRLDKLAVVHFRARGGNAGLAIPAETLAPTLGYLRDGGYTIVKVGTEPYPAEFARFDVVNYSESPLRSFSNDLALLCNAKLALINASGLENIVEVMRIPLVSYARWHLTFVPYSDTTVIVPSLLFDPVKQRLLSFAEQMLFFKTRCQYWERKAFCWQVPVDRYIPRNPQPDEMLAAVQEAVALGAARRPLSALQAGINQLDENGLLSLVESRVGDFFLERFQTLL